MRYTTGEIRTNLRVKAMYFCGLLHTDEEGLGDQLEPVYNSSVLVQDVAWKTYREQWTIETSDKWGPGKSVLKARHDDEYVLSVKCIT